MVGRPNKRPDPGEDPRLWFAGAGILLAAVGGCWLVLVAARLGGVQSATSLSGWVANTGGGGQWSARATWWLVLLLCPAGVVAVPVFRWVRRVRSGREWVDEVARSMSSRTDLAEMTEDAVTADTARLGSGGAGAGLRIAQSVLTRQWLWSTYEWSMVWILGTRAGKTRSVAVPLVAQHRGPVVTTSNKRDLRDMTSGPRSVLGRVWDFDPQGIAGAEATWWWNPLAFVTSMERAEKLVAVWGSARNDSDRMSGDAYFEPAGRALLADLVLAAALAEETITRVAEWVSFPDGRPGSPDPVKILRAHGYAVAAHDLAGKIAAAPDERSGLFGTANSFLGFLRNTEYTAWITPQHNDSHDGVDGRVDKRAQFDPAVFARSRDTLHLLSKDGGGSARAIIAALTLAAYTACEEHAQSCGGRLPVPALFMLDEAANVCPWPELPALMSHAGSRGIILVVVLQSQAQAKRAWGDEGAAQLIGTANMMVVGRGLNDADHLTDLARLVGDREVRDRSRTSGTGHRSTSDHNRDERILTEADLRALPRGRAVLFASGARPILCRLVDISEQENGPVAEASKKYYEQRSAS